MPHAHVVCLAVIAAFAAARAEAFSTAFYNPRTGDIRIAYDGMYEDTDLSGFTAIFWFGSAGSHLLAPSEVTPPTWSVSGTIHLTAEVALLPQEMTVFARGIGDIELKGAVQAGTPVSDLSAEADWAIPFGFPFYTWYKPPIVEVPEPTSFAMGGVTLVALGLLRRRQ